MKLPVIHEYNQKYRNRGRFALIDVDKCFELKSKFRVPHYPYLIAVKNNKHVVCDEKYGLTLKECADYSFYPPSHRLRSQQDVLDLIDSNKSFFLINHHLTPEEEFIIEPFTPEHLFYSLDQCLFGNSPLVYFRSADRQFLSLSSINHDVISNFLINASTPKFIQFTIDLVDQLVADNVSIILVLYHKHVLSDEDFYILTELSDTGLPVIYFNTEYAAAVFHDTVGTDPSDQSDMIAVLQMENGESIKYVQKNTTNLREFVNRVLNGSETQYVKSEDPPIDNNGTIKKVVGSTIQTYLENRLCLLVYKQENSAFESLLLKLNDAALYFSDNITFGFINSAKNAIPFDEPSKLPMIVFFENNEKFIEYEGKPKNFTAWIVEKFMSETTPEQPILPSEQANATINEGQNNSLLLSEGDPIIENENQIPDSSIPNTNEGINELPEGPDSKNEVSHQHETLENDL